VLLKRNALSLGEKLKVIEQLEQGGSQREIAITMGVSKTQI
jgi:Trp operon repressor